MENDVGLAKASWHRITRNQKQCLAFDNQEQRELLRTLKIHVFGMGIEITDKKNSTLSRPPFVLGELASLYIEHK